MNVIAIDTHRQIPDNDTGELYIVILARYNREAFIYPDLDTFISNNISNTTIKTINKAFISNEVVAIWRLKSSNIIITFKEEITEYKKGDN